MGNDNKSFIKINIQSEDEAKNEKNTLIIPKNKLKIKNKLDDDTKKKNNSSVTNNVIVLGKGLKQAINNNKNSKNDPNQTDNNDVIILGRGLRQSINNKKNDVTSKDLDSSNETINLKESKSIIDKEQLKEEIKDELLKKKDIDNNLENVIDSIIDKKMNKINLETIENDSEENKTIVDIVNEQIKEYMDKPENGNYKKNYILFDHVSKIYNNEEVSTVALDDASFTIDEGELVVFLGHSGAGKTTALNMLGGMDTVTKGRVIVDSKEISNYDPTELTEYRRTDIGFVFQFYNLVPNLSAGENVELSTEIGKDTMDPNVALSDVGLDGFYKKFPCQLSGGEQQRVAIARALAKNPKLLLCDEPTGALDYKTGKAILQLLQDTCRRNKITVIIITHNQAIAPMADKIISFNSGKVVDIKINENPKDIEEIEW